MSDNRDPAKANVHAALKDRVRELQLGDRLGGSTPSKSGGSTAWLAWMLCIFLAVAWAGVGIRYYRQSGSPAPAGTVSPGDSPAGSNANRPAGGKDLNEGELVLETKGYIIPSSQISISPIDVAGKIVELNVEEGKTVSLGDVLAVIDETAYAAEYSEALAQMEASKARLLESEKAWGIEALQSEADLLESRAMMAEARLVWETARASRAASAKLEVDQAQRKYEAAEQRMRSQESKLDLVRGPARQARIEALRKDLSAAEARLRRAAWRKDNCKIKSPVTGVILTKRVEVGSQVNPGALNSGGSSGGVSTGICDIADLRKLEVDLEVQERDLAKVKLDMLCKIRPDAWPSQEYEGYLERIMPIADRAKSSVSVRIKVLVPADEKQGAFLKPNMGVSVTFYNKRVDQAFKDQLKKNQEQQPAVEK